MSVGPILPPPARGGPQGDLPSFQAFASRRPARAPLSGREALLASLLLHAILALGVLTVPAALFHPGGSTPLVFGMSGADEDRIPMAFVQDPPRPPEPNPEARAASDRDRRRAQEEQPPDPAMAGPFSRGNTPALIAEGPLGGGPGAPPDPPDAGQAPVSPPRQPRDGDEPGRAGAGANDPDESKGLDADEPRGRLLFAPPRDDAPSESELEAKGERLRQALSKMGASGSVGGGGGVPYKFDNPTAGLSTPTGTLSFDTKGFDWGPYARRIYWIIWSNWHARMPPAIHTGLKGSVTVRFIIGKDGSLTGIQILSESGVPAYDSAAVLALEASNPLPPLPENFPNESEGVTGRFLYNIYR